MSPRPRKQKEQETQNQILEEVVQVDFDAVEREVNFDDDVPDELTPMQQWLKNKMLWLVNKRQNARLDDKDLAKYLGQQPQTLSHWIQGDRKPSYLSIMRIVQHLAKKGDNATELFEINDYDSPGSISHLDSDSQFIITNVPNLPPEKRQIIFKQVKEWLYGSTEERQEQGGAM